MTAESIDYSHKSLADKLGITIDANICLLNAPPNYDDLIDDWPVGASVSRDVLDETFSFIHYFVTDRAKLEIDVPTIVQHLDKQGMLWVSWPKKQASGSRDQVLDVDENVLREVILPTGLVDVKVVAVDETWSGLKFVWRKQNR